MSTNPTRKEITFDTGERLVASTRHDETCGLFLVDLETTVDGGTVCSALSYAHKHARDAYFTTLAADNARGTYAALVCQGERGSLHA